MAFRLAELFVEITGRDAPFNRALAGVHGKLSGLSVALGTLTGNLGSQIVSRLGSAASAGFGAVLLGASDLYETLDRTRVVLGPAADAVIGESDRMAAAFGVSKEEYLNAATSFAAAFKGAGKSQDEAAALGTQLTQLGMDMASLGNSANADVFTALQAALRGEFDPLERFNVFLTADAIAAKALAMGLAESKNELTDNAKKTAILALITKQSADAQGNLADTLDSPANAMKRLKGMASNLAAELGTGLQPAFQTLMALAVETLSDLGGWIAANKTAVGDWAASLSAWFEDLGLVYRNFGAIWEVTTIRIGGFLVNAEEAVAWFFDAVKSYLGWFGDNWLGVFRDAFNGAWTIASNALTNIKDLVAATWAYITNPAGGFQFDFTPLLDGFKATVGELPDIAALELSSVQGQIDAVLDGVASNEMKRLEAKAKNAAAAAGGKPAAGDDDDKTKTKDKDQKVETSSLEEFGKKLQEGIFAKDTGKQQLAVSTRQLTVQERQLEEARKANRRPAPPAVAG